MLLYSYSFYPICPFLAFHGVVSVFWGATPPSLALNSAELVVETGGSAFEETAGDLSLSFASNWAKLWSFFIRVTDRFCSVQVALLQGLDYEGRSHRSLRHLFIPSLYSLDGMNMVTHLSALTILTQLVFCTDFRLFYPGIFHF